MTLAQVEDEIPGEEGRGEEMLELANPPELRWAFTLKASLFQPLIAEASPLLLHSYWSANSFPPWHAYPCASLATYEINSMLASPQEQNSIPITSSG